MIVYAVVAVDDWKGLAKPNGQCECLDLFADERDATQCAANYLENDLNYGDCTTRYVVVPLETRELCQVFDVKTVVRSQLRATSFDL